MASGGTQEQGLLRFTFMSKYKMQSAGVKNAYFLTILEAFPGQDYISFKLFVLFRFCFLARVLLVYGKCKIQSLVTFFFLPRQLKSSAEK